MPRSAANSEEQEPLLGATGADEDWEVDKIASGQELSDYIPLSNTVSSEALRPSSDISVATDSMQPSVDNRDNDKKDQNGKLLLRTLIIDFLLFASRPAGSPS